MAGADAVVNCVGTFDRYGRNNFEAVQHQGAGRIAAAAARAGVAALVHISAIGADVAGASLYAQSKGAGEAAVLAAYPCALILRPSVIFGAEDAFFNRFASMAAGLSPILPVVGGATRFQPVYVDDVAQAAVNGILTRAVGVYELGGPEVASFAALMQRMLGVIQRRRWVVDVPFFAARIMAGALDFASLATGGLFANGILTRDQVTSLGRDNVVAPGAKGLADLGVQPTRMDTVLPEYLWPYRPTGQYAAIKASAKNLKKS
jgi:uncharacterized protein YbjT (DUF2867 family)